MWSIYYLAHKETDAIQEKKKPGVNCNSVRTDTPKTFRKLKNPQNKGQEIFVGDYCLQRCFSKTPISCKRISTMLRMLNGDSRRKLLSLDKGCMGIKKQLII